MSKPLAAGRLQLVRPLLVCVLLAACSSPSTQGPGGVSVPTLPGAGVPSLPGGSAGLPDSGTSSGKSGSSEGAKDGENNNRPQGTATEGGTTDGTAKKGGVEPGFDPGEAGSEALPDMRDTPQSERKAGSTTVGQTGEGEAQSPGGEGEAQFPGAEETAGEGTGTTSAETPAGEDAVSGEGSGPQGPLTPAEQVAILDAELERSTGDFDDLILAEQEEQRQRERERASEQTATEEVPAEPNPGNSRTAAYEGGMVGGSSGGSSPPQDPAKYPPPPDIPSSDGDDVVARQLREAAMRETDPAVREKLWDEYRKYKGIDK